MNLNENKNEPLNAEIDAEIVKKLYEFKPISEPSAYYSDKYVTIYLGDSYELLPVIRMNRNIDMILTDPPYLYNMGKSGWITPAYDNTIGFTVKGCDYKFLDGFENWAVFCSRLQLREILSFVGKRWNLVTMIKDGCAPICRGNYLPDVEYIVHTWGENRFFGDSKNKHSFVKRVKSKCTSHPNEKPINVISKLMITGTNEYESVCDPFAGSGTTGVVAKLLNRRAILIENNEKWAEVAANRCSQDNLF